MIVRRAISIYIIVLCVCMGTDAISHGYFEDRYFCDVEKNSVTVSLSTGEKVCFEVFSELYLQIEELDQELKTIQRHLEVGRDPVYRGEVHKALTQQYMQRVERQHLLTVAVADYERDLFIRVKSIVSRYVKPVYDQITQKIQQSDLLLARTHLVGDTVQYAYITQKMEEYYYMEGIIEQIKLASDFSELLPFVKIFVGEVAPVVSTDVVRIEEQPHDQHNAPDTEHDTTSAGGSGEAVNGSGEAFLPRKGSRK